MTGETEAGNSKSGVVFFILLVLGLVGFSIFGGLEENGNLKKCKAWRIDAVYNEVSEVCEVK